MKLIGPLAFALIAATGNAMFAAGQKKAAGLENAFTFISLTVLVCAVLILNVSPFFGPTQHIFFHPHPI